MGSEMCIRDSHRYKQKINKYQRVANQSGLQLIPAVFSHTGKMHGEVKRFIKDQIRLQLTYTEGEPKSSKVELAFRWWSKRISSVISRIGKALNVDRVPPLNDDSQDGTQFGSSGDDLQALYMCVCDVVVVLIAVLVIVRSSGSGSG